MSKNKEKGFFDWTFKRGYFWISFVLISFFSWTWLFQSEVSSLNIITIFFNFIILIAIFAFIYMIKNSLKKEDKNKNQGFLDWVSKKWYFWFFVIGFGIYQGVGDGIIGLLGSLIGSFLTFLFIFWIFYLISKVAKREKRN